MKIVPIEKVIYFYDLPEPDAFHATPEQMETYLYDVEGGWGTFDNPVKYDEETERIIVTFDDIKESFDSWDQEELDEAERYTDVHDYIQDCIGHGYHLVYLKED